MFGYFCGGRPVETSVSQVEPTKYVFTVTDAAKINFVAIFLLPGTAFPPDFAAAVYAQLPGKADFILLGALSASKQSAIFKLNMGAAGSATNDVDEMMDDESGAPPSDTQNLTFGISIEPSAQVDQLLASQRMPSRQPKAIGAPAPPMSSDSIATLANKIVGNAYNFLASFVDPQGQVPIKAFDDWWAKFKSRLSSDPDFLKSAENS